MIGAADHAFRLHALDDAGGPVVADLRAFAPGLVPSADGQAWTYDLSDGPMYISCVSAAPTLDAIVDDASDLAVAARSVEHAAREDAKRHVIVTVKDGVVQSVVTK